MNSLPLSPVVMSYATLLRKSATYKSCVTLVPESFFFFFFFLRGGGGWLQADAISSFVISSVPDM